MSTHLPPFPTGPFRFVALDVETANRHRGSICQIGLAFVLLDNRIETWKTYIDPKASRWEFTYIHGITRGTVAGAPTFGHVLPHLNRVVGTLPVYQHSNFDRGAVNSACDAINRPRPRWNWKDSVVVARRAWPELRGNGGHGLASLKKHLGLSFRHHDAGEDARAAAQVVLLAGRS